MTTETPVPTKVLDLLTKLKALAENKAATENEINVATEKMQKLLFDYNLSVSDIPMGDDGKRHVKISETRETDALWWGFNPYWKVDKKSTDKRVLTRAEREWRVDMAIAVARTNFCEILSGGTFYNVWFVGTEANVAAARTIWLYVCEQIHNLSYEAMTAYKKAGGYENGRSWRLNYCHGMMSGVSSEMYSHFRAMRTASAESMALVVVHNTDIAEFIEKRNEGKKPKKGFSTRDRYGPGWSKGYDDRGKVDTNATRRIS